MTEVGQRERAMQRRVVALFRDALGYDYLGDRHDRDNRNVEPDLVRAFLRGVQGYDDALVTRALHELTRAAGDASKPLYARNRDVYTLLRYGVQVTDAPGVPKTTVFFVDWNAPSATTSPSPRRSPSPRPAPWRTRSGRTSCCTSTASR